MNCASEPCRTKSWQGCWDPSGEQQWGFRSAEGQTKHPGANNYATHFGWCSKQESLPSSLGVQGLESIPTALTFNEQQQKKNAKNKTKIQMSKISIYLKYNWKTRILENLCAWNKRKLVKAFITAGRTILATPSTGGFKTWNWASSKFWVNNNCTHPESFPGSTCHLSLEGKIPLPDPIPFYFIWETVYTH